MSVYSRVRGQIKFMPIARSTILMFFSFVLTFTLAMPNQVMALGIFDQKPQPSVLPAGKVDITKDQATSDGSGSAATEQKKVDRTRAYEIDSKRTAFTSTYVNKDGTKTLRYSQHQQNYKDGDSWKKIENKLEPVEQPLAQTSWIDTIFNTKPQVEPPTEFKGNAGKLSANMKPLSEGLDITAGSKTITIKPVGARNVKPESKDENTVVYKDAWPHVDLEYQLRGEMVKEVIVIKDKAAQATFDFNVAGGKVIQHPTRAGELAIEGMPSEFSFSSLTLEVNERGVISEQRVTQAPTDEGIKVQMDEVWLRAQASEAFPLRIDPSYGHEVQGWWMYKSDGYSCNASNCHANIGVINDGAGWKGWRTYAQFPYNSLAGKKILYANMFGDFQEGANGITDGRWINMGHANCLGYNCTGSFAGNTHAATNFNIEFTNSLQQAINTNNFSAVWSFWGEEGAYKSFKPYYTMYADVVYDTPTPQTSAVEPAEGQVIVGTQPTLRINPVVDGDGDPVEYRYRVSTVQNGTGATVTSAWTNSTQWVVPDGILQDGTTYYWRVDTKGVANTGTETLANWHRSLKVDLRTGKDSTQAYDTVGPIGIDLATGNATTSNGTHTMNALGGKIGLNMSYDSPAKTQKGLTAEYWNVSAGYSGGVPTATPNLVRVDQNISNNWTMGNPGAPINNDWFYARWKGYFVAPTTGNYQFGGTNDDAMAIKVNGTFVYNNGGCYTNACYDGTTSLTAGQVVPIEVLFLEATGSAFANLFVKGAVAEQTVPSNWLQTEVKASAAQYGLSGRYYTDDGSHNFPTDGNDPNRFMLARNDSKLSFDWGTGGPATGLQTDGFMARWTGYITVPEDGTYTFGKVSDDGVRVKLNNGLFGTQQTVLDSWNYTAGEVWGSQTTLQKGQQVPIVVEYYEGNGPAHVQLRLKGPTLAANGEEIPVKWLTPKATALPDAWKLGVDVDGNVGYERLRVAGQNVILEDSTRSTHEYIWTGSGYKPPVNEDGQLTRNSDNTYTLLDSDGRTYVFDTEGKLKLLTSPTDDRNPASLKYEYAGDPSRLVKITDGVTSSRYGTLHYKNINEDGNCSVPGGFDAAPDGMLCAFKTSDGDVTKLYYKAGQLSRVEKPGNDLVDYGYDSLGRIINVRDGIAGDAITASIRADDATVLTEVTYDDLGRASAIKAPAPTASATRVNHTFEYLAGATQLHITGAPEPHGFSKRIEYDTLLRTTKETDVANLSGQTEWHSEKDLLLAKTDATGLKSTTIYDDDDRPVENYGPAPTAWYGADRKPTATYVSQVPKTSSGYDEGIVGPDVTYYNYKADNKTLVGTPKLRSNGFTDSSGTTTTPGVLEKIWGANKPITPDGGMNGWGLRATGKIRVSTTGTYSFHLWHDDGLRIYIDDILLADDWNNGSNRRTDASRTLEAGKVYRIMIEYYDTDNYGALGLYMSAPNAQPVDGDKDWSAELKPGYGLTTSQIAYDSQIGNITTTTTYNRPDYGTVDKTTRDPAGLNMQTTSTYETPGVGFLRQTSKTLSGGGVTQYQYYGATDTRDNPCTTEVESIHQAGMPKGKVEADPDGAGPQTPRTSETIYNHSGEVIATRYNNDDWTCTTYDTRGRVLSTIIPALGSKSGRTIVNDYAKDGNPLITTTTDSSGTIRVENDLLGRTVKYIDAKGKITENTYDTYGKLTSRTSPIGTETYEYDNYDRLTKHKLGGVTFATVAYDQHGRIASVQYPAGMSLSNITRDTLGRESGNTYILASGQNLSDQINRHVRGDIQNGTELGISKSYQYDKAGRLTSASIGSNTYSYDFGAQDSSCPAYSGYDAGKDGNRTKLTVSGQVTTYCYDMADRLVSSSDPTLTAPQYDSHGNTISLGDTTHKTEFEYDVSDRNMGIKSTNKETTFTRDVQNRIVSREHKQNGSTTSNVGYGFTGAGDTPDFLLDGSGSVIQKYLTLPGDVLVTIKPNSQSAGATTYSLPNIHGDVFATVNADGALMSTHMTGPFGEVLPTQPTQPQGAVSPSASPSNTADGTTYQYVGQHEKLTDLETSHILGGITQMGARVYIPVLGRFLGVDQQEGGTMNSYVYPLDPINAFDLNGMAEFKPNWGLLVSPNWWGGQVSGYASGVYNLPILGVKDMYVEPVSLMLDKKSSPADRAWGAFLLSPGGRVAKGYKLGTHAAERAGMRNVSLQTISHVLKSGQRVNYIENGIKKVGYYSLANGIFIATRGNKILTIINKVDKKYFDSVKKRR